MKVSVFIDGQNFYRSLQRVDETLRVDYDRLAAWIIQAVGGPTAIFAGAYYYVGVSADAPPLVAGFLKGLELRPGYFVRRELRVKRTARCSLCGGETEYTTEKRVDTRLVADLIHYAAIGAFDAAVLVSGDDDFVPAVEAVNALGRQVWVATWSAGELSSDLRVRCFGHLQLADGIAAFRSERPARTAERVPPRPAPSRLARVMHEGSIVVTASLAGLTSMENDPLYALTKHALVGFVRSVAPQLAERGIRLNMVNPGIVDTPLLGEEGREALLGAGFPLLQPEDVAAAVLVAARDDEVGQAWVVQPGREALKFRFPGVPGPRIEGAEGMVPRL